MKCSLARDMVVVLLVIVEDKKRLKVVARNKETMMKVMVVEVDG